MRPLLNQGHLTEHRSRPECRQQRRPTVIADDLDFPGLNQVSDFRRITWLEKDMTR
jgi:hypothetical protein